MRRGPWALANPEDSRKDERGQSAIDSRNPDGPRPDRAHGTRPHAPHPFLFLVLFMPFGAVPGFLTVALAYELKKKGIDTGDIAIVVGLSYVCLLLQVAVGAAGRHAAHAQDLVRRLDAGVRPGPVAGGPSARWASIRRCR